MPLPGSGKSLRIHFAAPPTLASSAAGRVGLRRWAAYQACGIRPAGRIARRHRRGFRRAEGSRRAWCNADLIRQTFAVGRGTSKFSRRHRRSDGMTSSASLSSDSRAATATCVPDGQDCKASPTCPVVNPVANAINVKASDVRRTRLLHSGPDVRLLQKQIKSRLKFLTHCARCSRAVFSPPTNYPFDLCSRASRNMKFERQLHPYRRKRANSSSPEIVSPRSASAIPASSSANSSGERRTSSLRSWLMTTTRVPSMNSDSSRTIWPETTVPVATRMRESYSERAAVPVMSNSISRGRLVSP